MLEAVQSGAITPAAFVAELQHSGRPARAWLVAALTDRLAGLAKEHHSLDCQLAAFADPTAAAAAAASAVHSTAAGPAAAAVDSGR